MKITIAADIGFSDVKAMASNGRKVGYPSVIAPDEGDSALDEALGASQRSQRVTVAPLGEPESSWLFGAEALGVPGATRPWNADASKRDGYDILVHAAIVSLLDAPAPDKVDADLVLGLPLGLYGTQRDALQAAFQDRTTYIGLNGKRVLIDISSVLVMPQAAGAYYAAVLNPDGTVREPDLLKKPVGVIDVGFRTTDFFVMENGAGGLRPVRELSGSLDAGVVEVHEGVRRRSQKETGSLIDPLRIEKALRNQGGILYDMGREIDLRPWLSEEAGRAARRVMDQMRVVWGKHLSGLGAILLAGGGAELFGSHMGVQFHPGLRVVEDPAFANARGFLAVRSMRR